MTVELYETVTGIEVSGRTSFIDTNDVNVQKAAYPGVVNGVVGDNTFSPMGEYTREQSILTVLRFL